MPSHRIELPAKPLGAAFLRCAALLFAALECAAIRAQTPGERPPPEIVARARGPLEVGRRALAAGRGAEVRAAARDAMAALGPWAGNPEIATPYHPPPNPRPFDAGALRGWWREEVERGLRGLPWKKNPTANPRVMSAGLREPAWAIEALARSTALFPEWRATLVAEAQRGADWLLRLQQAGGGFPFPVGPGLNPRDKVGHLVAAAIRRHPERVVDGWIADDADDGGLQFDHGLCGHALVSAWELTREPRYLEAARRAGEWAAGRALVPNWNYNAFSVGFLARLGGATGDPAFLEAAVRKADVGVLPGQMPGGRWFDPHNASAVYHNILLRELLHLFHALPAAHAFRATVRDALIRGLDQAAGETIERGFTGTWTDNFARALATLGEKPLWREALNVCVNAAGRSGAPTLGIAALAVLELPNRPAGDAAREREARPAPSRTEPRAR